MSSLQPRRIGWVVSNSVLLIAESRSQFKENDLSSFDRYSIFDANLANRPSNMFLLRGDLHFIFNEKYFTFVPKVCEYRPLPGGLTPKYSI